MPTIKELSQKCGLSISTVSKALNDYPDISADTKNTVRLWAEKLGYRPNSLARALKVGHTFNLGVLFVDDTASGLTHPYFARVLDSFKVAAEAAGYDITFINHNIGKAGTTYLEHCRCRKVDGVCLACVDFSMPEIIELIASDIPLVTIDHIFNERACVQSENRQGMQMLVNYAYDMGHRRIAYIHGAKSSVTAARLTSFKKTMETLSLPVPPEYLCESSYINPAATRIGAEKLLSLKERPTCIFLPDDYAALGAIEAISSAGLQVGKDISIAGYDGIELMQMFQPSLTTISQDTRQIGKSAADILIRLIEHPDTTFPELIQVPCALIKGETIVQPAS